MYACRSRRRSSDGAGGRLCSSTSYRNHRAPTQAYSASIGAIGTLSILRDAATTSPRRKSAPFSSGKAVASLRFGWSVSPTPPPPTRRKRRPTQNSGPPRTVHRCPRHQPQLCSSRMFFPCGFSSSLGSSCEWRRRGIAFVDFADEPALEKGARRTALARPAPRCGS